jgi:hypothetical protein
MNPTIERIKELLSKATSEQAWSCLDILARNSLVLTSVEIPLKNARDIYSRRASLNKDTRGPIIGFEELVSKLNTETIERVGIHSIEAGPQWLFVFTTPDMTRLIGVLCPETSAVNETELRQH